MNSEDLRKLKEWRERGGLTEEEHERWIAGNTALENMGIPGIEVHLHDMETNMALALLDFLAILGVGHEDIDVVLGPENTAWIEAYLDEQIVPMDEGTMAYRTAKVLFEPEGSLEDYGLIPTALSLPDSVWDALDESFDGPFFLLGPTVLDQNTKTVYMAEGVTPGVLAPGTRLLVEQAEAAAKAMMEVMDED